VLAQRLKELADAGMVQIEAKPKGKGHLYLLTRAGEDFRPIVELLSVWGQRWGQGMIAPDDLDPGMLVWGMRRQIDPAQIPAQGFVIRFDFRGLPKSNRSPRYWWLVLRPDDIEVCLKAPARDVDVVISADLTTFTKVWLGYAGLAAALASRKIAVSGAARSISVARRLLALPDQPMLKNFRFSPFPNLGAVAA
jgi:HxlR-like helix-turn-helix/SCP-2 sterol transfer family